MPHFHCQITKIGTHRLHVSTLKTRLNSIWCFYPHYFTLVRNWVLCSLNYVNYSCEE